jgi:ribosomal 30S subunit maturation factor RimM
MLLVVNEGKSHLIPAVENWIEEIDEIKKVILMRLPEGLAEI